MITSPIIRREDWPDEKSYNAAREIVRYIDKLKAALELDIPTFTEATAVDNADYLLLHNTVSGEDRKITVANFRAFQGALVYASAAQTLPHNIATLMQFDTEVRDTGNFFDAASPTRFVISAGVSLVRVTASARIENSSVGTRYLQILKNGTPLNPTAVIRWGASGLDILRLTSNPIDVVESDYIEVEAFQDSGGSLTIQPGSTKAVSFDIEVLE